MDPERDQNINYWQKHSKSGQARLLWMKYFNAADLEQKDYDNEYGMYFLLLNPE